VIAINKTQIVIMQGAKMMSNTTRLIETAMKRLEGRKTQAQVAKEAGFPHPNMLSMVKHGKSRLPLERVPALAEALEIDAALLFRTVLAENCPGYERVVIRIFGAVLTEEERDMIAFIRHVSGGEIPQLNRRLEKAIKDALRARE
jgi:transcriptional regulator with XRE-family HTH domain